MATLYLLEVGGESGEGCSQVGDQEEDVKDPVYSVKEFEFYPALAGSTAVTRGHL